MVSPLCLCVWQHAKLSDISLETRPRDSLVADEYVKKPTKQTNFPLSVRNHLSFAFCQTGVEAPPPPSPPPPLADLTPFKKGPYGLVVGVSIIDFNMSIVFLFFSLFRRQKMHPSLLRQKLLRNLQDSKWPGEQ